MTTPVIRLATSADSDAILGIYAPYIDTSITFEEETPTREAFQARTDGVLAAHPTWLPSLTARWWATLTHTSCANAAPTDGTPSFPCI